MIKHIQIPYRQGWSKANYGFISATKNHREAVSEFEGTRRTSALKKLIKCQYCGWKMRPGQTITHMRGTVDTGGGKVICPGNRPRTPGKELVKVKWQARKARELAESLASLEVN